MADINQSGGDLNWRLSAHPITLLCFLSFRIGTLASHPSTLTSKLTLHSASLLVYLLGMIFTSNFVLIFIITIILLAVDFYYLKNIAGRRLVGLRWWNEVNRETGGSNWVFESAPQPNEPGGKLVNATDRRFFWLALYAQPALWIALAIFALVKLAFIWLTLVGKEMQRAVSTRLGRNVLTKDSYCSGAHHYQHLGLFEMRQVQSSEWAGRKGALYRVSCAECGRCYGFKILQPGMTPLRSCPV